MSHIETTSARAAPGPLRVAHVVQSFDVGGIERVVDALATHAPDDMEHEVFAYLHDGPLRDALRAEGVRATFLPTETGLQPTLPLRLARHLRTRGVDVLHSHHVGPFLYGGVAARLVGIPHVHTEHSVELYDVWRRRLIGRAMPRLATVVAVAPDVARWRTDRFGDSPRVILNGIPVPPLPGADAVAERRGALGIGPEAFVVGCVARLAPEKAHGYLVDAFARLAESTPDAHLVLVGDGPERPIITRRAADRGVDGRVHLLGSRMDVPDLLGTFDVVALSSVREGLPLALLEAMALARPVVATAVGGVPELLHEAGLRAVPAADPEAMAEALLAYARDPEAGTRDGEAGRALVERRYSLDTMADAYAELYRSVVRRRGAA